MVSGSPVIWERGGGPREAEARPIGTNTQSEFPAKGEKDGFGLRPAVWDGRAPGPLTHLLQLLKCSLAAGEARIRVRDPPRVLPGARPRASNACFTGDRVLRGRGCSKTDCATLEGWAGVWTP